MESSGSGNVEPKRSAFKIRTKVGSQQGMRQSALIGEGGAPGLKPMSKREDRMANPTMAHSSLHKHQLILQKEALKQEEKKQEQEGPTDQDIVEKGQDYVVHNLKSKQANFKSSGNVKMNRTYSYEGLEIFSTRFSPDDTSLAIGTLI